MKRSAIIISIIITTFVLGIVGGVVKATTDARESVQVKNLQATLQAREDLYAETIAEANARIEQANSQLLETSKQKAQVELALAQQPTPEPHTTAVTQEQAIQLAMQAVGITDPFMSGKTELVEYSGVEAFQVDLSNGYKLYLNAQTGEILYNSLIGGPGQIIDEEKAIFDAVTYMKGGSVTSVERTTYKEQDVFLVTFVSGDQVYVNLAGQIVAVVQLQTYSVYNTSTNSNSSSVNNVSTNSSNNEDKHESEGEHEEDD